MKYSTHITLKGYVRYNNGVLQHREIWEKVNGKIPKGYCLHHKNGIKTDNRLENLEMVSALYHKRIHSGCKLINGDWWKPCNKCGCMKKIEDDYYKSRKWIMSICKKCCIKAATINKRKRKIAKKRIETATKQQRLFVSKPNSQPAEQLVL